MKNITMSGDEIYNIICHLYKLKCPTEILGCSPDKVLDDEKHIIIEAGRNLLLQHSNERSELLKWVDCQIFNNTVSNEKNDIEDRLSLIISTEARSFFSPVLQVSSKYNKCQS